jgi:hypothetical protein
VLKKPRVSHRRSIGGNDSARPGGKLLAIQDAAIRIVESSRIDARAPFSLLGKRDFNSTSHPSRSTTGANFSVCHASFPVGHVHAEAGWIFLGREMKR